MRIYADNSATTIVSKAALEAMLPCFTEFYGNPSAIHSGGQEAKKLLERSRADIARAVGALSSEIFFTSGGTESDNWAIHTVCEQKSRKGRHIISTAIEHNAVLRTLEKLESQGFEVTLLRPGADGQITPGQLESEIRGDTILVSIMLANNVAGTVLRIKELAAVARARRVIFHTDAVQAVGNIPVNIRELGVDMLSMSAHKMHGPKGVGALFCRVGVFPKPFITGGGQERGARSGTENIPGAVGMAAALTESAEGLNESIPYITALRDSVISETLRIPGAYLTGDPQNRLPGHASFVFEGIGHGAYLINALNEAGIYASSGSACSASSVEAPHVLKALGVSEGLSDKSLRISLSRYNTVHEVEYINQILPEIIRRLRAKNNQKK